MKRFLVEWESALRMRAEVEAETEGDAIEACKRGDFISGVESLEPFVRTEITATEACKPEPVSDTERGELAGGDDLWTENQCG